MTWSLRAALPGLARIRGEVGGEQEMSFNRLVFALVFAIYLPSVGYRVSDLPFVTLGIWSLLGLLVFVHIRVAPEAHTALRRGVALGMDMGFLTLFLHIGGPVAAPFYPVYIWVALGNGFRFGRRWLLAAMAVFILGFGWVALSTPYWTAQPPLAAGLLLGPCILGLYANKLIAKLSQARQQAEQANEAKSLFLASVSHDLRTPLHAIIGTGSLLRGTSLDSDQQEMARTIEDAAQTLLSRIGGILDFCRIEAGGIQVRAEPFDLRQLLAEVRRLLLVQAREKGLALTVHAAAGTPAHVACDRAHLRDVLLNLVGNAVKFTEAGSVVIAVGPAGQAGDATMLRFEVSDTGIGVDPAATQRIFEQFMQADGTIMNRFGGTGLGLAICRGLVRAMGGEIGVVSEPGRGSTFWFTIALAAPPRPEPRGLALAGMPVRVVTAARAPPVELVRSLAGWGAAVVLEEISPTDMAALAGEAADLSLDHLLVCGVAAKVLPDGAAPAGESPIIAIEAQPSGHGLKPVPVRRRFLTVLPGTAERDEIGAALGLAQALLPGGPPPQRTGAPGAEPAVAAPDRAARPERSQACVLVADDNAVNRRVLQRILERAGFAVTTACDGQEALDALDAGGVAVALMDVNMPVLDGIEATKLHRFTALGGPRLPIIGLTADASPETARRCLDAGMDQVLTKPVEEVALLQAITLHLPAAPPAEAAPEAAPEEDPPLPPALSLDVVERLVQLGGPEFLAEVAADFTADARRSLEELEAALQDGDALRFRAAAHGMRSSASSIGAANLRAIAGRAELVRVAEFEGEGPRYLSLLTAEVDLVCRRLQQVAR